MDLNQHRLPYYHKLSAELRVLAIPLHANQIDEQSNYQMVINTIFTIFSYNLSIFSLHY